MILRAISGLIEPKEENALSKIGRKWYAVRGHMEIELPALNMALVKVHQELAQVRLKAKDIAYKNKHASRTENENKWQLQELQDSLAELNLQLQDAKSKAPHRRRLHG